MISEELLLGYEATCYSVLKPKIDIFIKKENQELHSFLIDQNFTTWCFITAWNPLSKALSNEENKALNLLLEADLTSYSHFHAKGQDTLGDWPPEISFFVGNITKAQAVDLGKKYHQNAIVFGEINSLAELLILVD